MVDWKANTRQIEEAAVAYVATDMGRHVYAKQLLRRNSAKEEVDVLVVDRFTGEQLCVPVGRYEPPDVNGGWMVISDPRPIAATPEIVKSRQRPARRPPARTPSRRQRPPRSRARPKRAH